MRARRVVRTRGHNDGGGVRTGRGQLADGGRLRRRPDAYAPSGCPNTSYIDVEKLKRLTS